MIIGPTSAAALQERPWLLDCDLAVRLVAMAESAPDLGGLTIISGFRTPAEQDRLRAQGAPAAPNDRSNHLTCPARAADLRTGVAPVNAVKARFGQAAVFAGLRWGGGSPADPETGIPSDWNHLDLGPRLP